MTGVVERVRHRLVERLDAFVVRRMGVLADRAGRGVGPRQQEVVDVVADGFGGLWDRTSGAVDASPRVRRALVDQFQRLFYHSDATWQPTRYRGHATWKCPLDLWIYQELVAELRPDLIVETGTAYGGSGLFLADLCDIAGNGQVVTIDIRERAGDVEHSRLTKIVGSSVDRAVVGRVTAMASDARSVLVILDADHARDHVAAEMRHWAPLVTLGSYLVVEDTNVNGHPVYPGFGPGPAEAVSAFLAETDEFVPDDTRERFLLTWNPGGFLKRVSPAVADARPSTTW